MNLLGFMKVHRIFLFITICIILLGFLNYNKPKELFTTNNATKSQTRVKLSVVPGNNEAIALVELDKKRLRDEYLIIQYYIPFENEGKVNSKIIPLHHNQTQYTIKLHDLMNNQYYLVQCWLVNASGDRYASREETVSPKETLKIFV